MSLVWIIYLLGMLTTINTGIEVFMTIAGTLATISMLVIVACYSDGKVDMYDKAKRCLSDSVFVLFVLFAVDIFIPSEETAYTMLAAYGVEEIVTSPRVQELGGKSLEVLEKYLDEQLGEVGDGT